MNRPNILFIMSDEHDPSVTGCYGDPIVQTPNIDRLAEEGVTFDSFYCNSPLCVPSRLSFTSGKYIHRVGAWSNNSWLPSADYPSIAGQLNKSGYRSYLCGKQHYDASRRYGFEEIGPKSANYSNKSGKERRRPYDSEIHKSEMWKSRSGEFATSEESEILDHDTAVLEHLEGFFGRATKKDDPFFLFAGFLAPHFPLIVPEEKFERYRDRVPMPEIPEGMIESQARNYHQLRNGFGLGNEDQMLVKKGRECYWALVDWFDGIVGRLLDSLRSSEVADNTIIVYTSDHGENKGDHGLWWKNCLYDHAARVPLIVSFPKRWKGGTRRTQVCSHVDLVKTILELCESDIPGDWNGESLLNYLDDADTGCRDMAISQYYGHNISSGMSMYRRGNYKIIYHARYDEEHGPEFELYDLHADPKELNNLASSEKWRPTLEKLYGEMLAELGEDPDETELRCRREVEVGYGRN